MRNYIKQNLTWKSEGKHDLKITVFLKKNCIQFFHEALTKLCFKEKNF